MLRTERLRIGERALSIRRRVAKNGQVSYQVRVHIGYDETGKRLEHTETIKGSKQEAKDAASEIERSLRRGTYVEPNKVTVAQFMDEWLEKSAKLRLKSRTYQDYRKIVDTYVRPKLGAILLARLSVLQLQGFVSCLVEQMNLSPQTIRNIHNVVRGALQQAVKWKLVAINCARDVELPRKKQTAVVRSFEESEAHSLLDALVASRYRTLFTFALVTGARPAEYLALQWSDLNFATGEVRIERSVFFPKGGGWRFETLKTAKSTRTVVVPTQVLELLRDHQAAQLVEMNVVGPSWSRQHDVIFSTSTGRPFRGDFISTKFREFLQETGLAKHRLYDLRHTCATLLMGEGVAPKVVSERLGHAGVAITLDTYSHVLPSQQRKASDKLAGMLFKAKATANE